MNLNPIRRLYAEAANSQSKADELAKLLAQADSKNPTIIAYKGIVEAYKAKYALNPLSKLSHIQEANKYFKQAVEAEPDNIEIRFLRFTIQLNTPAVLGLDKELNEDRKVILANIQYSGIENIMKKAIAEYLIKSGKCSETEKQFLQDLIPQLAESHEK
ncbi:MAG: hypothetical protein NZ551_00105 [Microscillaceae bacterium]|nr:hypothetical protein [Microscillaceae bacterium]MDW8459591.1 hypothetical protein [Cytophagales bacterium]